MKKSQIIEATKQGLGTNNLRGFIRKNKLFISDYDKYFDWILQEERRLREKHQNLLNKADATLHKMSLKKFLALQNKATAILKSFHTGHSMGCHRNLYINKKMFASAHKLDFYSKGCKYQPTHGNISIFLTKKELENIINIDGIWTIPLPDNKCKVLDASGFKGTYDVKILDYYLIGNSHAKTLREAQILHMRRTDYKAYEKMSNERFVGIKHFINMGACRLGIKAFCDRFKLNEDFGYNLGYLRSLDKSNTWLQKV